MVASGSYRYMTLMSSVYLSYGIIGASTWPMRGIPVSYSKDLGCGDDQPLADLGRRRTTGDAGNSSTAAA